MAMVAMESTTVFPSLSDMIKNITKTNQTLRDHLQKIEEKMQSLRPQEHFLKEKKSPLPLLQSCVSTAEPSYLANLINNITAMNQTLVKSSKKIAAQSQDLRNQTLSYQQSIIKIKVLYNKQMIDTELNIDTNQQHEAPPQQTSLQQHKKRPRRRKRRRRIPGWIVEWKNTYAPYNLCNIGTSLPRSISDAQNASRTEID